MRKHKNLTCGTCANTKEMVTYFCDTCNKKIDYRGWNSYKHKDYLEVTFTNHFEYEPSKSDGKDFCSWTCLFKYLINMKDEYDEIELPEIQKEHFKEFISFIKGDK